MPRAASTRTAIRDLLASYTNRLVALVERHRPATDLTADVRSRVLDALEGLGGARRRRGRPRGSRNKAPTPKAPREPRKISAKQRRSAKLQGAYMGSIRTLPAADQSRVKAVRVKDGVEAAIKLAKSLKKAA